MRGVRILQLDKGGEPFLALARAQLESMPPYSVRHMMLPNGEMFLHQFSDFGTVRITIAAQALVWGYYVSGSDRYILEGDELTVAPPPAAGNNTGLSATDFQPAGTTGYGARMEDPDIIWNPATNRTITGAHADPTSATAHQASGASSNVDLLFSTGGLVGTPLEFGGQYIMMAEATGSASTGIAAFTLKSIDLTSPSTAQATVKAFSNSVSAGIGPFSYTAHDGTNVTATPGDEYRGELPIQAHYQNGGGVMGCSAEKVTFVQYIDNSPAGLDTNDVFQWTLYAAGRVVDDTGANVDEVQYYSITYNDPAFGMPNPGNGPPLPGLLSGEFMFTLASSDAGGTQYWTYVPQLFSNTYFGYEATDFGATGVLRIKTGGSSLANSYTTIRDVSELDAGISLDQASFYLVLPWISAPVNDGPRVYVEGTHHYHLFMTTQSAPLASTWVADTVTWVLNGTVIVDELQGYNTSGGSLKTCHGHMFGVDDIVILALEYLDLSQTDRWKLKFYIYKNGTSRGTVTWYLTDSEFSTVPASGDAGMPKNFDIKATTGTAYQVFTRGPGSVKMLVADLDFDGGTGNIIVTTESKTWNGGSVNSWLSTADDLGSVNYNPQGFIHVT